MKWLYKLLGNVGTVRFEGITTDGQKFSGKTEIQTIGMSRTEVEQELAKMFFVETGKRAEALKIIGYYSK